VLSLFVLCKHSPDRNKKKGGAAHTAAVSRERATMDEALKAKVLKQV
jgi:hypothetical protein